MKRFFKRLASLIPSKRKLMQLYFALLFNANLKGYISGTIFKGATKSVCIPGLNCYSCPGAVGACPLGSIQGAFSADKSTLFYVGGILLLYCIIFGRFICGWLCPFGFIQELVYKIKTPKIKKGPVTKVLSLFKYVVLVFFVVIIPLTYAFRDTPLPAFCKYICPAGTIEGGLGLLSNELNESYFSMLGPLFTWKFALMVSIIVASIFIFRMFCRFICPLGALYGLFNRFCLVGVKVNTDRCTNCDLCVKHCKMDISKVGDRECIACGECIDVCPTHAIVWKGAKILKPYEEVVSNTENPKRTRNIVRAAVCVFMVAVLVGVGVYTWLDKSNNLPDHGNTVGTLCYGEELSVITKDGIGESTINPATTGKITVINFWGTWCTPCVKELPYFDQIATDFDGDVNVIAIHTNMICETAPEYIGKYYGDSKITFAQDTLDEGYYAKLGGRGTYPYTVILDENGVIAEIFVSALEYEDLKTAIEKIG